MPFALFITLSLPIPFTISISFKKSAKSAPCCLGVPSNCLYITTISSLSHSSKNVVKLLVPIIKESINFGKSLTEINTFSLES